MPTIATIAFRDRVVEHVKRNSSFTGLRPDKKHIALGALDDYRLPQAGNPRKRAMDYLQTAGEEEGLDQAEVKELKATLTSLLDTAFTVTHQEHSANVARIERPKPNNPRQQRRGGKKARKAAERDRRPAAS